MSAWRIVMTGGCVLAGLLGVTTAAHAQLQGGVQGGFGTQQGPSFQTQGNFPQQPFPVQQPLRRERTQLEMNVLYGTSIAYGVGMGIWVSTEAGFDDPAIS